MLRTLSLLACLCLAGGARAEGPADPLAIRQIGSRVECPGMPSLRGQDRAPIEAACFKATGGRVARAGNIVTFRLDDGKTVDFEDDIAACAEPTDACRTLTLTHFDAARHFAIFEDEQYENYRQLVLDLRTGETQDIDWYPTFSPSGNRFFAVINDLSEEAEFEVKVFDVAGPAVRRVYAQKTGSFRALVKPRDKQAVIDPWGWDGEDRVRLRLSDGNDKSYGFAVLAEAKGRWSLRLAKAR